MQANRDERLYGNHSRHEEWGRKVASIPLNVVGDLYKHGINILSNEDWPKIAAKLDSPEWEAWRTAPGKISRRAYREYYPMKGNHSMRRVFRQGESF